MQTLYNFRDRDGNPIQISLAKLIGRFAWLKVGEEAVSRRMETGSILRREVIERLSIINHRWPDCQVRISNQGDEILTIEVDCDLGSASEISAFIHQGYIAGYKGATEVLRFCFRHLSGRLNTNIILLDQEDIAEILPVLIQTKPSDPALQNITELVRRHGLSYRFVPTQGMFCETLTLLCPNDKVRRESWSAITNQGRRRKQPLQDFL